MIKFAESPPFYLFLFGLGGIPLPIEKRETVALHSSFWRMKHGGEMDSHVFEIILSPKVGILRESVLFRARMPNIAHSVHSIF